MNHKIKQSFNTFVQLFNFDKILLVPIILLCLVNIVVQYSATDKDINQLINDSIYIFISLSIMFIIANLNLNHLKIIAKPLYVISIILLLCVMLFGISVNGARRWLTIGVRIQPSELSKLAVPLLLASYFSTKPSKPRAIEFLIAFIILIVPFLLITKQPDLGTGILVFSAGFYIIFFAGLSYRIILILFFLFICSTPIIWHFLHSYQQHRILTFINPQSDPLGKGYHIIQGMIAIGSGGMWGKGYLQGTQTHLNFIPEKNTDFVITVIGEEFGFIGITIILFLYMIIILRGLSIMNKTHHIFGKTLAGSITMSLMTYILINMGMVTGIFPVVGVPLPLISHGGTATMVIMAEFGILLAISKSNKY